MAGALTVRVRSVHNSKLVYILSPCLCSGQARKRCRGCGGGGRRDGWWDIPDLSQASLCLSPTNPQTNTYQAILSTDGSRSYAMFLYQSGGMQWDVTQRPGNPVLMGFSR